MANQFAITPLIKKINGATFITFQATGEDLTFTFQNSNKKFVYSKFALLNIPAIKDMVNNDNSVQFAAIEGHFNSGLSAATPAPEGDRVDLSESFQNYVLNLESLLLRSSNYDQDLLQNPSERIFFKWLKEIGAMRYREANSVEKASTVTDPRFVEEDENDSPSSGDLYEKVVQYIGEIDIDGSHRSNTNAFKEVYIYVPTQNGNTPVVMFNSFEDANYFAGMTIIKEDNVDIEFIAGRDAGDDPTSAGLTVRAFYDMDVPLGSLAYVVNGGSDPIWFTPLAPNGPNAYFTDPVFGDVTNDEINRTNTSTLATIDYKRSRLDGIMIDWEKSDYKFFENTPEAVAFNEYNATDLANSFEFNTVLLYYDIYDPNDPDGTRATNLYGVLFIEDLEVFSAGAAKLKTLDKIKPNPIIGQQGNGYGIKMNFKFDVTADNVASDVEISVNDYNTFSMQLFSDTMQRIGQANTNFEQVLQDNLVLTQRIADLEALILSDANTESIQQQIDLINETLQGVTPTTDLQDLIQANTDQINAIISGQTDVDINLVLQLQAFDGLSLSLQNNVLQFRNNRQRYTDWEEVTLRVDTTQANTIINKFDLGTHDKLIYHKNGGIPLTAQANVEIYINDDLEKWENGQSVKIVVLDEIDFNGFGFALYTDADDASNLGAPFQKLIGVIPMPDRTKPELEIVCVDKDNLEFVVWQK